ncbi:MAG: DNA polymerase II large subunit [Halobacteriales archaeon]|nr:DNA polymerase II large subunit [Halobacteriales archaeon]
MTDEAYFEELEERLDDAIALAGRARERGADPTPEVEIPVAKDLADRVENLIGVEGVAERIRALEETEDSREDVALRLAEEFAEGEFPPETRDEKAEAAIRTAVALLTEGVVAAPIEGIDGVELLENDDGTEYLKVEYAGPIRSAGGTAQALSVLIADYVGSSLGVDAYKPRDDEVERYIEEVNLYAEETGLQYTPKDKETRLIVENCPICLDGEPTTEREVSGYRDLERIGTNRGRGGMCLVAAEGIALKAPKIKKYVDALEMDGWDWIEKLMHDTSSDDGESDDEGGDEEEDGGVKPNPKFLRDLTAGRPIFSHPSRPGGFRLRYARARNTGLAAAGVSPATMVIFDDFLAAGTQIKTERPGKAEGVAPVDGIEGPTVVLSNGEVRRIDTEEEARRVRNGVERIVDIGEIALNHGEFLENNHPLVPGAYTYGWWIQELEDSEADVNGLRHAFDLEDLPAKGAFRLSRKYGVPLPPRYTYLWHDIERDEYDALCDAVVRRGEDELVFDIGGGEDDEDSDVTPVLEKLLVPHIQEDDEARVEGDHAYALGDCLDASADGEDALSAASDTAGVEIRERAPTRVGARMGRPEKSKKREMSPAVHCLFPIGDAGGSQRDIDEAASHAETMRDTVGEISVSAGARRCPSCGEETYENVCNCGTRTKPVLRCPTCDIEVDGDEACPRCGGETTTVQRFDVRIDEKYREALDNVGERASYDILKCVKGLMSERETPEPLEKGVLRAKHDVSTFKDGTVRYDMTDLPLTSFRPDEIGVSVERLREMGYEHDIDGEPLREPEQVVELMPQDVVLSRDSAEHLARVADFVDDLLVQYYGVEPYHELDGKDDMVGELVMGLAPHTSAGVLGRVVGFTDASVGYAHPFFHAAKRRNCDGDEDCVTLMSDALLNFSREYLPDRRGGRMDAPLVMTSRIDPTEIDDEAHNVDKVSRYSASFHESAREYAHPKDVDVRIAEDDLGTSEAFDGFGHTVETTRIDAGPENSAYKILPSMNEKTMAQLEIGRKTRAVDESDVAERVVESHFLPDLIGNLRAFTQQEFRCLDCNQKFRRPPLSGDCDCGGQVTLTVHKGSVKKYLDVALETGEKYGVSDYTMQRLEQLQRQIDSLFEDDKSTQSGIADFM